MNNKKFSSFYQRLHKQSYCSIGFSFNSKFYNLNLTCSILFLWFLGFLLLRLLLNVTNVNNFTSYGGQQYPKNGVDVWRFTSILHQFKIPYAEEFGNLRIGKLINGIPCWGKLRNKAWRGILIRENTIHDA